MDGDILNRLEDLLDEVTFEGGNSCRVSCLFAQTRIYIFFHKDALSYSLTKRCGAVFNKI